MPPNPSRICSEAISCPGSPAALPSIRKQANKQPSGPGLQQCFPVRSVEPYGAHRAVLFTGSASAACIFVHICPISLHADRAHRAQRDTYAAPRTQISVDLCRHHFSLHRPGKGRFSRCAHTSASHAHPSSARASASHTLASASDSASSSTAPTSHTPSSASPHTHAFLSLFPCRTASDGYPPGQMSSAASHRPRGSCRFSILVSRCLELFHPFTDLAEGLLEILRLPPQRFELLLPSDRRRGRSGIRPVPSP